jgi:hypothetical protein
MAGRGTSQYRLRGPCELGPAENSSQAWNQPLENGFSAWPWLRGANQVGGGVGVRDFGRDWGFSLNADFGLWLGMVYVRP